MNYLGSKSHCKHGRQHNKVQLDFILSKLELEYTFLDTKRVLCRRSIDRLGSKNTKYTGIQGKPTRSLSDLKKKKRLKPTAYICILESSYRIASRDQTLSNLLNKDALFAYSAINVARYSTSLIVSSPVGRIHFSGSKCPN